jgi:UDP-hydrolysing UDP-N-acetyl-D-glucosamine 2-epimerase
MADRPLKIMAVSGSRADWGYLSVPLTLLQADPAFHLSLVVTGQHLDASSGGSAAVLKAEGFTAAATVEMGPGGGSEQEVTHSMARGLAGFGDAVASLKPDLMLLLGDRYETLAAGCAALLSRCPVAHIAGGDISEGAVDDAIRHALTKLAHIHFPTNRDAADRIIQMGENPARVHCVGSTGLDRLMQVQPMPREDFFRSVGLAPGEPTLLVTMHPVTLAADPLADAKALLSALGRLSGRFGMLITGSNADAGGKELNAMFESFAREHPNAVLHASLGTERYVNALAHCEAVAGNSSSGLYEAPSMKRPTVNIGERQKGRMRAASVIDCPGEPDAILQALRHALTLDCRDIKSPYGDGRASERIVAVLKEIGDARSLLHKSFHMRVTG